MCLERSPIGQMRKFSVYKNTQHKTGYYKIREVYLYDIRGSTHEKMRKASDPHQSIGEMAAASEDAAARVRRALEAADADALLALYRELSLSFRVRALCGPELAAATELTSAARATGRDGADAAAPRGRARALRRRGGRAHARRGQRQGAPASRLSVVGSPVAGSRMRACATGPGRPDAAHGRGRARLQPRLRGAAGQRRARVYRGRGRRDGTHARHEEARAAHLPGPGRGGPGGIGARA